MGEPAKDRLLSPNIISIGFGVLFRLTVTHFQHHVLRLGHLASFPAGLMCKQFIDRQFVKASSIEYPLHGKQGIPTQDLTVSELYNID